tara:strand:+ start:2433 stop:3182 length:750 start_codon:yes stop_codon:yes gene_type:complete
MKLIKVDDYQTWYVEESNKAILIDPWLTKKLEHEGDFFINRSKDRVSYLTSDQYRKIQALIITAPFEDHLHIDTIKSFSMDTPIYTSKIVKTKLLKENISNPIFLLNEKGSNVGALNVKSLPTSYPYYNSTFSLLIEDKSNKKIFHEGHIVNFKYLKKYNIKADVAILTADEVKLFGLITLGMSYESALKACNLLDTKNLFITGTNPNKTKGFISKFLTIKPLIEEELNEKLNLYMKPGDNIDLNDSLN